MATISFITQLIQSVVYFSMTQNPIKSCLLYYEVLKLFSQNFSIHKDLIKEKQEKILTLGKNFIEEIETEERMREILQDIDIKGRSVETLIKSHPTLLLKIETVVENKWTCSAKLFSRDSLEPSSLFFLYSQESQVLSKRELLTRHKHLIMPFQFEVFRRSPFLKYLLSIAFTLGIGVLVEVVSVLFLTSMRVVFANIVPSPSDGVLDEAENALKWLRIFALVCQPLTLLYPLQSLVDFIFAHIANRPYQITKFELVTSFTIILMNIFIAKDYNFEIFAFDESTPLEAY